jgi:hypothetical protein
LLSGEIAPETIGQTICQSHRVTAVAVHPPNISDAVLQAGKHDVKPSGVERRIQSAAGR